jgi:hypothetical protein
MTFENLLTIIFGITTVVMTSIALRYTIREHRMKVDGIVGDGRNAMLFLSRQAMLTFLGKMYNDSVDGDVIWGQCVSCRDYSSDLRNKVLQAAGKGVHFKIIINGYAPTLNEFRKVYDPINTAELVLGYDNSHRLQGLSEKEVILAFPGVETYTGLLIRDPFFVRLVKGWFDARFETLRKQNSRSDFKTD